MAVVGTVLRRGAPLVAAGAIGAGIAVGVTATTLSGSGGTTTVVEQVSTTSTRGTQVATSQPASTLKAGTGALSIQEIYTRCAPGVVQISAVSASGAQAVGSGFVIDRSGHVVTNYHVVADTTEVRINFSGRDDAVAATVVGTDPSTDIAVLEVGLPASALTPLSLGDSDAVSVGDPVVAIGNPFALERTVTAGIVSAIQREISAPNGFPIDHVIQTDAAINHGNSGGPLLDSNAEVIGVASQIETGGYAEGNVGVGFAIPINTVKQVAAQLIQTGKVERAFLGIEMQTITAEAAADLRLAVDSGVLVATVRPGSPAAEVGLRGGGSTAVINGETWVLGGDVITKADGQPIENADELRDIVLGKRPGDTITLEINRDGETMTFDVKLGRQPATPSG